MSLHLLSALLLTACGGEPQDTGFGDAIPDIRGHWQVFVTSATGCEGHSEYIQDWAYGPLTITGDGPRELTYVFNKLDAEFQGSVNDSWSFQLSGDATWTTEKKSVANLQVYEDGMVIQQEGYYRMEGEFEVIVDDDEFFSNDCTLTADSYATQLSD